jgi:hypothetical protein
MKILILVTGHQQNLEYKYFGQLLSRCAFLSSSQCEVFIHSNKYNNDISENIKYILNKKNVHVTNKNAGYTLGGIEAVGDCIDMLNLCSPDSDYDFVIHVHPDVFITNDTMLVNILNDELYSDNVFLLNKSFHDDFCASFDFFIFKPRLLNKNIFANYANWQDSPERYLKQMITSNDIKYKYIKRFDNDHYEPRRIDLNLMWHEHNLEKVEKFIQITN